MIIYRRNMMIMYRKEGIAGSASPFCFLLLVGGMPRNPGGGI